ncbi:hypothetical protein [Bacteroides fluxus]|nr:hypothetical protein [Bacteroides fluxus]
MTASSCRHFAVTFAVTTQMPMEREFQGSSDGVTAKYEKTPCSG